MVTDVLMKEGRNVAMEKSNARKLMASAVCIVASVALLAGLTFAWFTDTATSKDNRIQAGTLKVELLKDGQPVAADAPIFAADKWEPGFSTGAGLAVKNAGDLAIKYELAFRNIVAEDGIDSVLDVYVLDSVRAPASADTPVGTLADFKDGRAVASSNLLKAGQTDEAQNVVVKMREGVGNAYAGKTVTFDILLRATQAASEKDGFGNDQYDAAATLPTAVSSPGEFTAAMTAGGVVELAQDVVLDDQMTIGADTVLDLNGHALTLANGTQSLKAASGTTLTIEGNGTISGVVYADNNGTVVIDVGNDFAINAASNNGWAVYGAMGSSIVINGGTYTATQKGAGVIYTLGATLAVRNATVNVGAATVMNSAGVYSNASSTTLENVTVNAGYSIAVDLKKASGSAVIRGGQFVTDKEADGFSSPTIRYQGTLDISDASITRVNTGIKFSRSYPAPTEVEGLTYANLVFTPVANAKGNDIDYR